MGRKRLSALYLVTLVAGISLLLAACDLVIASNPSPASPLPPDGPPTQSPAATPTATPDLRPTIDAMVQRRIAEILTPSPRPEPGSSAPADPNVAVASAPATVHTTIVTYAEDLPANHYISRFACTGSMRPTIDCGDEGVFQKPPFQEPLVVGDVISFLPEPGCTRHPGHGIVHRITEIKAEEGVTHYTTKGDASTDPDRCEITIDQIDGKLVDLRKGARPQDIIDTSEFDLVKERINALKAQYKEKKAALDLRESEYNEMREVFDQSKVEYDAHGETYELLRARYQSGEASYQEVQELYQDLEEERGALIQLKDDLNSLAEEINTAKDELNSLGREINAAIGEENRLFQELFMHD